MEKTSIGTNHRAIRKINRAGICKLLIFAVAVQSLGSCQKDDPHNTPHPDKGAVVISTDWSGRSSDAVLPRSYLLRIGTEEQTVDGETNAFGSLFAPGKQNLLVWHNTEGITVGGTTATVNTLEDGTLEATPGYLFSAARELEIVKDDTLRITLPMKQHIRRLVLTLKLNPGDEHRISSTTATLTGIASTTDLATGKLVGSEGKTVVPIFTFTSDAYVSISRTDTPQSRTNAQPALSSTLHLMGVATGEQQLLALDITLTGGDVHTVTTDLTDMLRDFRTDENMEPLVLDAELELSTEAGFTASIGDWNLKDNGDITVN